MNSRYRWLLVAVLFWIGALNYCDRSAIASIFPLLRSGLGLSDVGLASVGSFFLWAYMLAAPFGGILSDTYSRSRIIVGCLAGWSLITLGTGLVSGLHQLLASRVILGIVEAAYYPAAAALIADHHPPRTRATAIGIHAAGMPLGVVLGGTGLGYIGEHFGWRIGFLALGLAGLLLALVARPLLHDSPPGEAPGPRAPGLQARARLAALLQVPSFVVMVLASMIVSVGNWIFVYWLPLYFREVYGMNLARAGFAGTFMLQAASIVAGVLGGIFSDRFGGRKPRRRMILQILSYLAAVPFVLVFLSSRPDLALLNACMFLFSFFIWFGASNVIPLTCDLLPPGLRATAVSLISSTGCLAGGIGVILAGLFKSSLGLGGVFAGISGLTLLAAGILVIGHRFFPESGPVEGHPGPG